MHSVAKQQKTQRGDPLGTLKKFRKKCRTVPKKRKGGPFSPVRACRYCLKSKKPKGDPLE